MLVTYLSKSTVSLVLSNLLIKEYSVVLVTYLSKSTVSLVLSNLLIKEYGVAGTK